MPGCPLSQRQTSAPGSAERRLMQALFVHGMGRSPVSALPLLWRLERRGVLPFTFFYTVTFENFSSITRRLQNKIIDIGSNGDYVLIGHSLGGVLIRDAMSSLPARTCIPAGFSNPPFADRTILPAKLALSSGDPGLWTITCVGRTDDKCPTQSCPHNEHHWNQMLNGAVPFVWRRRKRQCCVVFRSDVRLDQ